MLQREDFRSGDVRADTPFWFERQPPVGACPERVTASVPALTGLVPPPAASAPQLRQVSVDAPSGEDPEFTRRWSENWERELDAVRAQRLRARQARGEPAPAEPTRDTHARVGRRSGTPARTGPTRGTPERTGPTRGTPARTGRRSGAPARVGRGDPRRRRRVGRLTRPTRTGRTRLSVILVLMLVSAAGAWVLGQWRSGTVPAPARVVVGEAAALGAVAAPHTPASAYAERTIPRTWLRMYWQAGAEYGLDWTMLAAVGTLESDNGASSLPGVARGTNAAGVAGPAQFATGTWARYSVNVHPGHTDAASRYNAADAITTMAAYLKASGAPQNWPAALYAYNHSTAYVQDVLALAARYRA